MSYSRLIESNWYCYPQLSANAQSKPAVVCIRGNGFDTYFWEAGTPMEEFIEEVAATMKHDEFYEADLCELKKILEDHYDEILKDFKPEEE